MSSVGIDTTDLDELLQLREEIDEINAVLGERKKTLKAIESRVAEQFALNGVNSMNVNGSTIYRHTEKYANAKKEHRSELVDWARENELDDMIVLQPSSFKSWCKEQLQDAGGLPAEIAEMVDVFEKSSVRVRKS